MKDILSQINQAFFETSILEWSAVISAILYVIFAARKSILCWPFALLSSFIYVFVCYFSLLYLEMILQFFYFGMGIYGWILWRSQEKLNLPIIQWNINKHLLNIVLSAIASFVLGFLFSKYTAQENPYFDAFTTCFSLTATFMVAKKVLENWIYWIIIDFVSIFLYQSRGLYLSALLFIVYTILAIFGYISWRKQYKRDDLYV